MPIRALTIDFWNTIVVARTGGERRQQQRFEQLRRVVQQHRPDASDDLITDAYRTAVDRFDHSWREQQHTPRTSDLVAVIWETLGFDVEDAVHRETVRVFEEGLLHGSPDFAEGLEDALAWAAGRYPLGIISDTMFSPGRVIRQLLDARGVRQHFQSFVFSDETGFSKPDVRAFEQAAQGLGVAPSELAHIGDLRRTDVAGARTADAGAILFTGVRTDDDPAPEPDVILSCWRDLPDVLARLG
ncbi:MAG: HAD-IA family hydrolase [Bacteroidetes bacterium]|jgi:putative hydrolase of the HAD superfamily|nr:HAD-IA family hydrolase [Bacteroidota bacterium]